MFCQVVDELDLLLQGHGLGFPPPVGCLQCLLGCCNAAVALHEVGVLGVWSRWGARCRSLLWCGFLLWCGSPLPADPSSISDLVHPGRRVGVAFPSGSCAEPQSAPIPEWVCVKRPLLPPHRHVAAAATALLCLRGAPRLCWIIVVVLPWLVLPASPGRGLVPGIVVGMCLCVPSCPVGVAVVVLPCCWLPVLCLLCVAGVGVVLGPLLGLLLPAWRCCCCCLLVAGWWARWVAPSVAVAPLLLLFPPCRCGLVVSTGGSPPVIAGGLSFAFSVFSLPPLVRGLSAALLVCCFPRRGLLAGWVLGRVCGRWRDGGVGEVVILAVWWSRVVSGLLPGVFPGLGVCMSWWWDWIVAASRPGWRSGLFPGVCLLGLFLWCWVAAAAWSGSGPRPFALLLGSACFRCRGATLSR